jgi:coenzyme F420-reducing hydrogenase delta subunit
MSPKPEVVVLACQQALPEFASLQESLQAAGLKARVIPEPCSSKIEAFQLLRILASDADSVWVVGCPEALCLFTEGSFRMGKRLEWARTYLTEIGLEPERLSLFRLAAGDKPALVALAGEVAARAQALGLNPGRRGSQAKKEQHP